MRLPGAEAVEAVIIALVANNDAEMLCFFLSLSYNIAESKLEPRHHGS